MEYLDPNCNIFTDNLTKEERARTTKHSENKILL